MNLKLLLSTKRFRHVVRCRRPTAALVCAVALAAGCKGGGGLGGSNGHVGGPPAVSFSSLPVGDQELQTVTLFNSGMISVPVDALTPTGDFSVRLAPVVGGDGGPAEVPGLPYALDPGQSVDVVLAFRPAGVGPRTGTLTVASGNPSAVSDDPSLVIPLSGSGIDPSSVSATVSPVKLDFGAVGLGGAATQRFKLSNPNQFAIVPQIAAPTGSPAGQFGLGGASDGGFAPTDGGLVLFLDGGDSAYVQVTFAPTAVAAASGVVSIRVCQNCDAGQQVTLTGIGQDGALQAAPNPLDFGLVLNAVEPPATLPVSVTASGDTPVTVGQIRLLSPNSVFQLAPNTLAGTTLQPMAAQTLQISYSPSGAPGGDRDTLEIQASILAGTPGASDRTLRVPVQGNTHLTAGCHLSVSPPAQLDFGTLAPGKSFTDAVTVTNQGALACQLSGVGLGADSDPAFALGTPSVPLSAGGAVTLLAHGALALPITFSAPSNSFRYQRSGSLVFSSTDPTLPQVSIALAGRVLSLTGNSPWPKWRHDNGNTGQGETDTSQTQGKLLWSYQLPNAPVGVGAGYVPFPLEFPWGPMLGPEGDVYQVSYENGVGGTGRNTFVALKPLTGALDWSVDLSQNGQTTSFALPTPTLAQNNSVYLTSPNLYSISPVDHTATLLAPAQATTNQYTSMAAVGPGGQFYASEWSPSENGSNPQGVDLQVFVNGMSTHAIVLPLQIVGGAGAGNTLFFTGMPAIDDRGDTFWCLQGTCFKTDPSGTLLWLESVGLSSASTAGSPVLSGSTVFYQAQSLQLDHPLGLPAQTQIHNQVFTFDATANSSAPSPTLLYETTPLPLSDPNVVSTRTLGFNAPTLYATPAVAGDGAVVFGGLDGIYCVESAPALRGRLRWRVPVAGGTQSTPSLGADGTVYIGTAFQGLLAIDLASGAVRWSFSLPGAETTKFNSISSTPALGDNVVYFTGDDGILYAVQ